MLRIQSPSIWGLAVVADGALQDGRHVAALYGVPEADVRRVARAIKSGDVGELVEDPRPDVRRWLATYPPTSVAILQLLAQDEDESVRMAARDRLRDMAIEVLAR